MYRINNESLRKAAEEHRNNTGMTFADEVCLLRALIEDTLNESENATDSLARLHGPLSTVVKSVESLHKIRIAEGHLLCVSAAAELGREISDIISAALTDLDEPTRNKVIDKISRDLPLAIENQMNPHADLKKVGFYTPDTL